ncbi:hypothetical protein ES703_65270 [subsurface metagenome]
MRCSCTPSCPDPFEAYLTKLHKFNVFLIRSASSGGISFLLIIFSKLSVVNVPVSIFNLSAIYSIIVSLSLPQKSVLLPFFNNIEASLSLFCVFFQALSLRLRPVLRSMVSRRFFTMKAVRKIENDEI